MACWRLRYPGIGNWPDAFFANDFIAIDYPIEESFLDLAGHPLEGCFRREVEERLPSGWDKLSLLHASENIWNFFACMREGDMLLCRDRKNLYHVGVLGDYAFKPRAASPHRRSIKWQPALIPQSGMSHDLRRACSSWPLLKNISAFGGEIKMLLEETPFVGGCRRNADLFFLDLLLEQFVAHNWRLTPFADQYDLCPSGDNDSVPECLRGISDLLARSLDGKSFLAVEFKKCRDSQDLFNGLNHKIAMARYQLRDLDQSISGAILTTEKNARLAELAAIASDIRLYVFNLDFRLANS